MRFHRLIPLLVLGALGAVVSSTAVLGAPGGAAPAGASAPPAGQTTRIAVVKPTWVFLHMKETAAIKEQVAQKGRDNVAKSNDKKKHIQALQDQRSDINPSHPSYRDISSQIDTAEAEYEVWAKTTQRADDREQKLILKNLYDKLEAAVGEIAQRDHIDLVITDGRQEISNVEGVTANELRELIHNRNVLYANPRLDISEKVLALLDAKYAMEKKQ
ncbi:MAG TPA: OmpH family outer membrane protein [Tepidisphaeraceae bacterium]|nr:OmpH family outer membrane protein [Tepidisphaeraceae bacterium]